MIKHRCSCQFVPPIVLENMAKNSVNAARVSTKVSQSQRSKRAATAIPLSSFTGQASKPTGDSQREVYNCKHRWELRVPPVARQEGDAPTGDEDTDLVYDFAGKVRDYFRTELGRRSIDDAGMKLIFNVHYGVNYMNAFWDGDEMVFGDGDGTTFTSFARSLDVVAHELAHGVTEHTANLDYYGQSGALNESFSDVFGAAITQHVNGQDAGNADWLIGDEIMGPSLFGEALRSMKAPGTAYDNALIGTDPQPAHMDQYYGGPDDRQGVHINSGIPNRAFYLTATSIGTDKAVRIWYRALQNLWPAAKFADAAEVIVEAARILTRDKVVPLGSVQNVRAAFKAVGL